MRALLPFVAILVCVGSSGEPPPPAWSAPHRYRLVLAVDARGVARSHSPASVEVDLEGALRERGATGTLDPASLRVIAYDEQGEPRPYDPALPEHERSMLPWRLDKDYRASRSRLAFVLPDERSTRYAVYFDTEAAGLGRREPPGLIGDGDRFTGPWTRRGLAPSHLDDLCDVDGDGDQDLLRGGVPPWIRVYENLGGWRFADRGRLTSAGEPLLLPASADSNRSWVTVTCADIDDDGDADLLPSFSDGPDAGDVVVYRSLLRQGRGLTFERLGALRTASGQKLGGAKVWFPAATPVRDWDGDGDAALDFVVARDHRLYLHRNLGARELGLPRLDEGEELSAGDHEILVETPRAALADTDGDGDLDLIVGSQPGRVSLHRNLGSRSAPRFARGEVIAWGEPSLIDDAHSGAAIRDVDGDGRLDLLSGRLWERASPKAWEEPRRHGGLWRNVGTPEGPAFAWTGVGEGAPYLEGFLPLDAMLQNAVRVADWDGDGKLDLVVGDSDGLVWLYRNTGSRLFPSFSEAEMLRAGDRPVSVAGQGGYARPAVADWDGDGLLDLLVADAAGGVTLFRNGGRRGAPQLAAGEVLRPRGADLGAGPMASVAVCDWNGDGLGDLITTGERGRYSLFPNRGSRERPVLGLARRIGFGKPRGASVRPILGACVDWDGDGRRDLVASDFEDSIRLYRNLGSNRAPALADAAGEAILVPESAQMISGADVVDWRGDGDLDLVTGMGHGGSGVRFYERDYLEDLRRGTLPLVRVLALEVKAP